MFPEAPLYTSVYNPKTAPWAKVFPKIYTSFLQKIPFVKNWHEGFAWLMPLAFELFDFSGYDLVISVTSEAAKGIITKPQTKHLCYCLTPTRYLWSGYNLYFRNPILKLVSKPIVSYLRGWDKIAGQRPDRMIAISTAVKQRIKKYYGRDSEVVFPPIGNFNLHRKKLLLRGPSAASRNFFDDAFLVVSRLVPYKRVDLAIKVFNQLGWPLMIVGTGSEEKRLKSMSKSKNIKFFGEISEQRLAELYAGAKALILPQEEDFGLVAIEAHSLGTPVIAFKKGGALDSVIEDKTGIFFDRQTPESLMAAVKKFDKMDFNHGELIHYAKKFSKEKFQRSLIRLSACGWRGDASLAEIERECTQTISSAF
jgi:glycosyltransferase involved in cell wall biosynthesis